MSDSLKATVIVIAVVSTIWTNPELLADAADEPVEPVEPPRLPAALDPAPAALDAVALEPEPEPEPDPLEAETAVPGLVEASETTVPAAGA
jgi:hypothetical protein